MASRGLLGSIGGVLDVSHSRRFAGSTSPISPPAPGRTPSPVGRQNCGGRRVTAIAAGSYHTVALRGDGSVYAWGDNRYGQTTVPAGLSGVTAIAGGYRHTVALKGNARCASTSTGRR